MGYRREESVAAGILGWIGKIIVYAIVGFMMYEGVTKGYAFGYEVFYPTAIEAEPGTEKSITIEEGTTPSQAADQLIEAGLIRNKAAFMVQALFYDYTIYPGTYELNTSMTSKEMLEILNTIPIEEDEEES